jgi:DNA-binding response OmpR family regulator
MSGELLLLVEDDEAVAEGLALILSLEGFRVKTLTRGRPVFGLVSYSEPDLVIMDVTLPDIDGVTVARELRRNFLKLPIILMTGHDISRVAEHLRGEKAIHMLQKPFDMRDLVDLIGRILTPPHDV